MYHIIIFENVKIYQNICLNVFISADFTLNLIETLETSVESRNTPKTSNYTFKFYKFSKTNIDIRKIIVC